MTSNKQSQKSGSESVNVQVHQVNIGLTHEEARQLFMDLYKQNAIEYIQEAQNKADERIRLFADKFLHELAEHNPEAIKNFTDPDVQSTIFEAQRGYAKKGGSDLERVLIAMLVDRVGSNSFGLKEAILNEAIVIAPKLTIEQLNLLSILFILKYTINNDVFEHKSFGNYLRSTFGPLIKKITFSELSFRHLEFHGCFSITMGSTVLNSILHSSYGGLFSKGFEESVIGSGPEVNFDQKEVFVTCLNDPNKFQINAMRESDIEHMCNKLELSDEWKKRIKYLFTSNLMSRDETQDLVCKIFPEFNIVFEKWMDSMASNSNLTTVGRAIAISNMHGHGQTGFKFETWLTEKNS